MRELFADGVPDAVLFDLDGTLYRQAPVRRTMVARLIRHHVGRPSEAYRVARVLGAYRRAQEELRASQFSGDVATRQIELAATRAGCTITDVRIQVERWMESAPLETIARHRRHDVALLIDELGDLGVALGIVSDYPAAAKLKALGLAERFDVVVSAQDSDVGGLKPDPRGLLLALERLGAPAARSWYVGDRVDVDMPAAKAAGMSFMGVGSARSAEHRAATRRDVRRHAA